MSSVPGVLSKPVTLEEYLEMERQSVEKHDFWGGEILNLAGCSDKHDILAGNLLAALHQRLRHGSCRPYSSNMKLYIPSRGNCVYPDVTVVCGERQFLDGRRDVLTNPVLLFEVLSDSTEAYDRGEKFRGYQDIPSFQEYVLISQKEMRAERFFRHSASLWEFEITMGDGILKLKSIPVEIPLSEIYEGAEMVSPETAAR